MTSADKVSVKRLLRDLKFRDFAGTCGTVPPCCAALTCTVTAHADAVIGIECMSLPAADPLPAGVEEDGHAAAAPAVEAAAAAAGLHRVLRTASG